MVDSSRKGAHLLHLALNDVCKSVIGRAAAVTTGMKQTCPVQSV